MLYWFNMTDMKIVPTHADTHTHKHTRNRIFCLVYFAFFFWLAMKVKTALSLRGNIHIHTLIQAKISD